MIKRYNTVLLLVVFFACLAFGSSPARAAYPLSGGNVPKIDISRIAGLQREVSLEADGRGASPHPASGQADPERCPGEGFPDHRMAGCSAMKEEGLRLPILPAGRDQPGMAA
jgi:hypothetical protein